MKKRRAKSGRAGLKISRLDGIRVSRGFTDFVLDQLQGVPDLFARPMFGGVGLYSGDTFFGIIANDKVFLKVNDRTRPRYVSAGMKPFKPYAHRPTTFMYYEVPLGVLESAEELVAWAKEAVVAATRQAPSKASARLRRTPRAQSNRRARKR